MDFLLLGFKISPSGSSFYFGSLPRLFKEGAEAGAVELEAGAMRKFENSSCVWWIYSDVVKARPALSFLR